MKARLILLVAAAFCLGLVASATPQFMQIVKLVGVAAAVDRFGPDINRAMNKLQRHEDGNQVGTKVVPIISGGINSRRGIGAAQVMGPPAAVKRVKAVAQLDQDLFGEIKIRAMIPIESDRIIENLRRVEGVAVSGIIDLRL